jgi:hypothetical protein
MTLNKKLTTALGYEIYGKEKESNFIEALLTFAGITATIIIIWLYLIALN